MHGHMLLSLHLMLLIREKPPSFAGLALGLAH